MAAERGGAQPTRRQVLRLGALAAVGADSLLRQALAAPADPEQPGGTVIEADLCVYGATPGGISAALQARQMGKTVAIVESGRSIGGITTSGLSATDVGRRSALGGFALSFYEQIRTHYLETYGLDSRQYAVTHTGGGANHGYRFEPYVATQLFQKLLQDAGVPVFRERRLKSVTREEGWIRELVAADGTVFRAKVFVDATYEGDLLAAAGVTYTVGREANAQYGETLNGAQFGSRGHNFKVSVDPYHVEGQPSSGLLPSISPDADGEPGEGDRRVQAYCFRLCITRDPKKRIPFPRPREYDPRRYLLLARYLNSGVGIEECFQSIRLPNGKADLNNNGAFSTNNLGMNYDWPEGDLATRRRIYHDHMVYQRGLLWFLGYDGRVPAEIRREVKQWGLAADEFPETQGWPPLLYVREGRRMVSDFVMTEQHCLGRARVQDGIGLGAYPIDSHHVRRIVKDGRVVNEGNVIRFGFPSYPISYRALVPREKECRNLLVPVCLSASHVAYGSMRMEPAFMVLGQAAGTAAALAIDRNTPVQKVDVGALRKRLYDDGQNLGERLG